MGKKPKKLYRYELEVWKELPSLELKKFEILRYTPKGFWIKTEWNREKWVSNFGRSRYAQTSKREALKHYIRRKTYRNHCIMNEMERNDRTILIAKELLKKHDKQGKK